MEEIFATLANYLWKQSINNINQSLNDQEKSKFSNNDYYYLTVIFSLESPTFGAVAEALHVTKPAVSSMIKKLTNLGLVEKVQDENDKRKFYVVLSAKGENIVRGDYSMYQTITKNIKEIVSDEEQYLMIQKTMEELLERLRGDM